MGESGRVRIIPVFPPVFPSGPFAGGTDGFDPSIFLGGGSALFAFARRYPFCLLLNSWMELHAVREGAILVKSGLFL